MGSSASLSTSAFGLEWVFRGLCTKSQSSSAVSAQELVCERGSISQAEVVAELAIFCCLCETTSLLSDDSDCMLDSLQGLQGKLEFFLRGKTKSGLETALPLGPSLILYNGRGEIVDVLSDKTKPFPPSQVSPLSKGCSKAADGCDSLCTLPFCFSLWSELLTRSVRWSLLDRWESVSEPTPNPGCNPDVFG